MAGVFVKQKHSTLSWGWMYYSYHILFFSSESLEQHPDPTICYQQKHIFIFLWFLFAAKQAFGCIIFISEKSPNTSIGMGHEFRTNLESRKRDLISCFTWAYCKAQHDFTGLYWTWHFSSQHQKGISTGSHLLRMAGARAWNRKLAFAVGRSECSVLV